VHGLTGGCGLHHGCRLHYTRQGKQAILARL